MPVLKNREIKVDVDGICRDVVTMGLKMVTRGFETGFHRHRKAQCVLAVSGVLTCESEGGIWIVPPRTAIWMPPGVEHCITFAGNDEADGRIESGRPDSNRRSPAPKAGGLP